MLNIGKLLNKEHFCHRRLLAENIESEKFPGMIISEIYIENNIIKKLKYII